MLSHVLKKECAAACLLPLSQVTTEHWQELMSPIQSSQEHTISQLESLSGEALASLIRIIFPQN